jgi:hypothetical protein
LLFSQIQHLMTAFTRFFPEFVSLAMTARIELSRFSRQTLRRSVTFANIGTSPTSQNLGLDPRVQIGESTAMDD